MTTVVIKEKVDIGGVTRLPGVLVRVSDDEADQLVRDGVADIREPHDQRETKEDDGGDPPEETTA